MKRAILAVLYLTGTCLAGSAQEQDSSVHEKKTLLFPVPAIGKSIETSWYFGAVCMFTFRNYFNTPQYSTAKAKLTMSVNRQVILSTSWFVYTNHNNQLIIGDNSYLYFPENYYGIGNRTPASNEMNYAARRTELYNSVLWKIRPPVYAGVSAKVQGVTGLDIPPASAEIANELEQNNAGWSYGAGPHLMVDKRDRILNPSAGSYFIDIENINYLKEKQTHNTAAFASLKTDLRYYSRLFPHAVLVWQFYSMQTFGYAPYRLMGLLGSDSHMRGYYQGRYRDKNYAAAQVEARVGILPWLGITAFGGYGDVWDQPSDVTWSTLKYTTGGGIRIRMDKTDQTNLRFDYAMGRETSGFYVAFGEAF